MERWKTPHAEEKECVDSAEDGTGSNPPPGTDLRPVSLVGRTPLRCSLRILWFRSAGLDASLECPRDGSSWDILFLSVDNFSGSDTLTGRG